jgi:hypothetical protein
VRANVSIYVECAARLTTTSIETLSRATALSPLGAMPPARGADAGAPPLLLAPRAPLLLRLAAQYSLATGLAAAPALTGLPIPFAAWATWF